MKRFVPTAHDVQWTKNLLSTLRNGGTWVLPACQSVYTVDHESKTLTCTVNGSPSTHSRIRAVCARIGWTVKDGSPSTN